MGEASNPVGNLYPYVSGNPVSLTNPNGDIIPLLLAAVVFAAYEFYADTANAPGPCDATQPENPFGPLEAAVTAAGAAVGIDQAIGLVVAARAAGEAAPLAQVTPNRIAGNAFRDSLADSLRAAGRDVETEV